MKKLTGLIAFVGIILFLAPSCMKEKQLDKMETQIINVTIHKYDTYKFTLPENTSDDEFQITEQASHYSVSQLDEISSLQIIYTYKPTSEYVGTDRVVIANVEDHDGGNHHGHGGHHNNNHGGGCNQDDSEIERTIIINFNVLDTIVGKPNPLNGVLVH